MWTKTKFICYFVENCDFHEICGDYYDSYENKRFFISNALWDILNRMFFSTEFPSKMEVSKLPWLQKNEYLE